MEDVPGWIEKYPGLYLGIVIGGVIGMVVGFVLDHREGNLPVSWWQLGGIGAALGAIANFMLLS
jgi:hypothetical protein